MLCSSNKLISICGSIHVHSISNRCRWNSIQYILSLFAKKAFPESLLIFWTILFLPDAESIVPLDRTLRHPQPIKKNSRRAWAPKLAALGEVRQERCSASPSDGCLRTAGVLRDRSSSTETQGTFGQACRIPNGGRFLFFVILTSPYPHTADRVIFSDP